MDARELLEQWKVCQANRVAMMKQVAQGQRSKVEVLEADIYQLQWFMTKLLERQIDTETNLANLVGDGR